MEGKIHLDSTTELPNILLTYPSSDPETKLFSLIIRKQSIEPLKHITNYTDIRTMKS